MRWGSVGGMGDWGEGWRCVAGDGGCVGLAAVAGCWATAEMMVVDAAAGSWCAEMGRSRAKRMSKKTCEAVAAEVDVAAVGGDVGTAPASRRPDAAG